MRRMTGSSAAIAEQSEPALRARFPLGWRALAVLLLFGGSLLLGLAASGKAFNYHEARYAQGAREMLENGSWLVPTIGKRPRLQKPPIVYWSMAASMAAFGSETEWPARLPSVVAALTVAILVADLGARQFGSRFGLVAGLAQLSSVYVLVSGPLADPDMLLAAVVTLGTWSFARFLLADRGTRPRRFAVAFWVASALAFLVKGPIGPVLFVPAAVVFSVAARRRDATRFFFDPLALGCFALFVVPWPLAAYLSYPGILGAWGEENVARFRGELGRSSPLLYLYTAPWMALPWTPLAVAGAVSLWKQRPRDPIFSLFLAWLCVDFVILSLSAGKHDRYLVPVLPPLALFAARGLLDAAPRIAQRGRPAVVFAAILTAEWVVAMAIQRIVALRFDAYGPHRALAQRVNREITPGARLLVVAVPNNVRTQLLYYLPSATEIVDEPQAAATALTKNSDTWLLAPAAARDALSRLGSLEVIDRSEGLFGHHQEADRLTLFRLRAS
jgi:4-amino-4-deoxy-L-arabinose transferase-like glycosyltransferase